MKIEHISISREQCFNECGQKYKFRYHLKTISPEPEAPYFTFGKVVHVIAENYVRSKGKIPIDKLAKDIFSGKMELQEGQKTPPFDPEQKTKLVRHLDHFARLTDKIGFDGEVEWKFTIDMDGKGRCMTGVIDRLIRKGDNFFILDYKTTKPSKWRKDSRTITKDLQLQCYCYVVKKQFGVPARNIESALMYLDDNQLIPVRFSEKTLDQVPERLLKVYKTIENTEPDKVVGKVGRWCDFCEYKSLCPFFKAKS